MTTRDKQRVRAALAGSESACAEIVRRYQRPVFSIVVRMVRDRGIAEDLTQETFIKAFRALHTFDQEKKLSSWLFSIAHNTTIDHLRRKTLPTVPLETADGELDPLSSVPAAAAETPERVAMGRDLRRVFEEELQCLRPEYAEILVLRFQENLAYEEIAEITGLPMGTVKTHLFRARRALAERLARRGMAPGD
ncbi:MAG: sigma-70 family RNA polymerase sigma factor [Acidobacteriota bacterium]|nr:sigma-70 family RNA polymerase sigma factor [Acidobacteriota bacterium]